MILVGDDGRCLAPLESRGARIGVVSAVMGFQDRLLVFEGERALFRQVSPLFGPNARLLLIPPGSRARFDAGITLAGHALFPLLVASDGAFHSTGLSRRLTDPVLEKTVQRALRAWLNARRKGWTTVHGPTPAQLEMQIAEIERFNGRAGRYFRAIAAATQEFMR